MFNFITQQPSLDADFKFYDIVDDKTPLLGNVRDLENRSLFQKNCDDEMACNNSIIDQQSNWIFRCDEGLFSYCFNNFFKWYSGRKRTMSYDRKTIFSSL